MSALSRQMNFDSVP